MICILMLAIGLLVVILLTNGLGIQVSSAETLIFIMFFGLSYFTTLFSSRKLRDVRFVLFVSFLVKVFLLIWDIYARNIYKLPSSGTDATNFYNNAVRFAIGMSYWKNSAVSVFGTLMKLFGQTRLMIQFLLMLLSVASAHLTNETMIMLDISKKNKRKALWFMGLLPNYAIVSCLFLRESLVTFFVALSLLFFVRWWKNKGEFNFVLAIAVLFVGMIFHSGIVGVAVGYVGVRFLYNKKQKTYTLNASSVLAAVVLSVVFMYLYNRYSSLFFGKMSDIDELSDIASGYGRGGSSYASIAGNSSNIVNFIIYTPIRIFLFLFTPLFFQIRGLSDIIAMVFSAFFYMWAYYMAFKALKTNKRDKNLIIALLIVAISVAFIFGWGGTNIGTNVRHRDKVMPIYITLLAISFERRPREIKEAEITKLTD